MRPLLVILTLCSMLATSAPSAADDPAASGAEPVGKIVAVEKKVMATLGADSRRVGRGDAVYRGDWIETEKKARAKIELHDETELVVGPSSRIHIDDFVYEPSSGSGKVLVEMGVGLMRFTTGVLEPESYEVKTPVASIGVRGTIFDVLVAAVDFATTVILREGKIVVRGVRGMAVIDQKDDASSVESLGDEPSEPREATKDEEDQTDPLDRPFRSEIETGQRKPTLPGNVTKPRPPSSSPDVHSIPSPPSTPSPPNIPSHRY